jgi:predicted HAD superfamily Cof-like phosphohydrolase
MSYTKDVRNFHDKFGLVTPPAFTFLAPDLLKFRVGFFYEEFQEYKDSYDQGDLGTAIDSLIDLVYITCGAALLHGIQDREFDELVQSPVENTFSVGRSENYNGPVFLTKELHEDLVDKFTRAIEAYKTAHAADDEEGVHHALVAIYQNAVFGASEMGLTQDCWDEFWNDVQRANMSKERATKASDSKRGSTFDVIKPAGWKAPDTEGILAKWVGKATV